MKRKNQARIVVVILLSLSLRSVSQVHYSNEFFQNPERIIDYVNDCANFWIGVHDDTYGGFYTGVSREGNVLDNKKHLVSQSRDAYGFARAYMLTGDDNYLNYSLSALQFMYDHLWDDQYKGWFKEVSRTGSNPFTGEKSAFDQHYALLGITAYFEATKDSSHFYVIDSAYTYIEDVFWDETVSQEGYFDHASRDGSSPTGKSFNSTMDAVTTHLYNLYLMTGELKYLDRLNAVKTNIFDNFHANMSSQAIGFPEEFYSDWSIDESETMTIMGHVLKTAWSLGRIHRVDPDQNAVDAADDLIQDVLDNGYDHTYGGPYKDYNRVTGDMLMWGAYDIAKAWWQMEQAVTSGFMLFEVTWDQKYLTMADESFDFFMNYFVDPVYGEVYADRSRTGGRVSYSGGYWDENKGSDWKAAYHSIETGYYSYIYSKLLLKQEPLTLYYKIDALAEERTVVFNPVAVDLSKLSIDNVTLDGTTFASFDANTRTITIPSGTGGEFAVTYVMTGLDDVFVGKDYIVKEQNKIFNYPNPVKNYTQFVFNSDERNNVSLTIQDITGKVVYNKPDIDIQIGKNSIEWYPNNLPQGIYVYRIKSETESFSGKFIITN